MSLFPGKCARCGQSTRELYDGRHVCAPCRQVFELKLAAAEERRHACPVDGTLMIKSVAHLMIIDRCPACQGVWLDAGELESLTAEVAREAMMAIARGAWAAS